MRRVNHLPLNDKTNGWSRILSSRTPKGSLETEVYAHTVVVGAGYAGLAAARRMAENLPNEHIVLLEAGIVGENASGRNSGFAIDVPHVISSSMDELEKSQHHMALSRAAIDYHERQINEFDIDCSWSHTGKYQTAVTDEGVEQYLKPFMNELKKLNEPFTFIEGDSLEKALGTGHFVAGVYTPGTRLLNPAALVRGLADTLPENVSLYEQTPVIALSDDNGINIRTTAGGVRAKQMILAVNGFANHFGFYTRHLITCAANASLSRRLTESEQQKFGCTTEWGVTPANAFASVTMRYTQDCRILMRHNIYYNREMREKKAYQDVVARHHKRLFDERFPMLPEVEMEYTWTGYVTLSHNGSPGFGRIADRVYSSVCQNAIGVTKGTVSGMLAADMVCGVDNELIGYMEGLGQPNRLLPWPFLDMGVKARMFWEINRAKGEV